jgi:hypothetical protein
MRYIAPFFGYLALGVFSFLITISGLMVLGGCIVYIDQFTDRVTLPNGMILKRQFDWEFGKRHDMFASDGDTVLARNIEFVCFNDRYVKAIAYPQGHGGLFDGRTNELISRRDWDTYIKIYRASGLQNRGACNGYYTAMIGPGLLYDGNESPLLPSCEWRNLENTALADRSWFDRPCADRALPPRPGG